MLIFKNTKIFLFCIFCLHVLSLSSLYSGLHQGNTLQNMDIFYKQVTWICVFWLVVFLLSFVHYRIYYDLSIWLYILTIILLIYVIFFGKTHMGAQRWIHFPGFNFQPSELAKVIVVMILARFFSTDDISQPLFKRVVIPFILVSFAALLIFKQPDLGTALILIFIFCMMGLSSPSRKRAVVFMVIFGMLMAPFAWKLLKPYQKKRLTVFINPDIDPLGAGYTIIQSKIAIGSGGFFGKGFLSGTQNQFNFLPERHTDFIFTIIAEEFGFMGSIFLLLLYFMLFQHILQKAKNSRDSFAQFLAIGIFSILFLHLVINLSMTMGLLPVVGLPLLFVSYGGTHLLITAIIIGVFLSISRNG